jgi:hypothetical protein
MILILLYDALLFKPLATPNFLALVLIRWGGSHRSLGRSAEARSDSDIYLTTSGGFRYPRDCARKILPHYSDSENVAFWGSLWLHRCIALLQPDIDFQKAAFKILA